MRQNEGTMGPTEKLWLMDPILDPTPFENNQGVKW